MEMKFTTSINCGACVKSVTKAFNDISGIIKWTVDTDNPSKFLCVESDNDISQEVIARVKDAGFDISLIS